MATLKEYYLDRLGDPLEEYRHLLRVNPRFLTDYHDVRKEFLFKLKYKRRIERKFPKFEEELKNYLTWMNELFETGVIKIEEKLYLAVYLGDFELKSYGKNSKMLYDNYILFGLEDMKVNWSFDYLRSTYTAAEYESNYTHSHVSGIPPFSVGGYCKGYSELSTFKMAVASNPVKEMIQTFLIQIEQGVKWESGSGGPYRKLKNFGEEVLITEHGTDYVSVKNRFSQFVKDSPNFFGYKIDETGITIRDDENFNRFCAMFHDEGYEHEGVYYKMVNTDHEPKLLFSFKGKEIYSKVLNKGDETDKRVPKIVRDKIKYEIERYLTTSYLQKSRDALQNSIDNRSEVVESNPVSL